MKRFEKVSEDRAHAGARVNKWETESEIVKQRRKRQQERSEKIARLRALRLAKEGGQVNRVK